MLVFETERVKLESGRSALFISLDHLPPAAGIAGDGVDRQRLMGLDYARVDERPQQSDGAGGVAADIGHARGAGDSRSLIRAELRKAVDPARRDTMRGRGVEQTRRLFAERVTKRDRLPGGVVGQAEDGD